MQIIDTDYTNPDTWNYYTSRPKGGAGAFVSCLNLLDSLFSKSVCYIDVANLL
jgi:hypothetical protein